METQLINLTNNQTFVSAALSDKLTTVYVISGEVTAPVGLGLNTNESMTAARGEPPIVFRSIGNSTIAVFTGDEFEYDTTTGKINDVQQT